MQRINHAPDTARYIGSDDCPGQMSEAVADRLDRAIEPAYIQDQDGTRHYFDLKG